MKVPDIKCYSSHNFQYKIVSKFCEKIFYFFSSVRRESSCDWWMEETSQPGGTAGLSGPGLDDTSVPSIKSTSSLDPELSLHPFSVLSQVGGDGDDVVQSPAQTPQTFQLYPLTPR